MTRLTAAQHPIVMTHPVEEGATLGPALQADGYLGAAKLSHPDCIGQACAAAGKERSHLR
jgi:hypothetical protein